MLQCCPVPAFKVKSRREDDYGDSAPEHVKVKYWVADFKRSSKPSEPGLGVAVNVASDTISEALRQLVLKLAKIGVRNNQSSRSVHTSASTSMMIMWRENRRGLRLVIQ